MLGLFGYKASQDNLTATLIRFFNPMQSGTFFHLAPHSLFSFSSEPLQQNNLAINKTVFLGDAKSDFEAAKSNNIDFILRSTNENKNLFRNGDKRYKPRNIW